MLLAEWLFGGGRGWTSQRRPPNHLNNPHRPYIPLLHVPDMGVHPKAVVYVGGGSRCLIWKGCGAGSSWTLRMILRHTTSRNTSQPTVVMSVVGFGGRRCHVCTHASEQPPQIAWQAMMSQCALYNRDRGPGCREMTSLSAPSALFWAHARRHIVSSGVSPSLTSAARLFFEGRVFLDGGTQAHLAPKGSRRLVRYFNFVVGRVCRWNYDEATDTDRFETLLRWVLSCFLLGKCKL